MTAADPVPAPLEANNPQRARALKAKIHDRVSDVRRHLLALRTAMAISSDVVRSRPAARRQSWTIFAPRAYPVGPMASASTR